MPDRSLESRDCPNPHHGLVSILHDWRSSSHPASSFQKALGWSRRSLFEALHELRDQGYVIEEHPYHGVRLLSVPPHLHPAEVLAQIETRWIGTKIRVVRTTPSTQDIAWDAASREGAGLVVLAREQTRGRGSRGRKWFSPLDHGLYMSAILESGRLPLAPALLTLGAALAVSDALRITAGVPTDIDWPNDLVAHGRKVAGILVESRNLRRGSLTFVVGVGVNLLTPTDGWPREISRLAIALDELSGSPTNPSRLAGSILNHLDAVWSELQRGQHSEIRRRWIARCALLNRSCTVEFAGQTLRGTLREITPEFELLLETACGAKHRVPIAHVRDLRLAQDS